MYIASANNIQAIEDDSITKDHFSQLLMPTERLLTSCHFRNSYGFIYLYLIFQ